MVPALWYYEQCLVQPVWKNHEYLTFQVELPLVKEALTRIVDNSNNMVEETIKLCINDDIEVDCEADTNILDEHQLLKMQRLSKSKIEMKPTIIKLETIQCKLNALGKIEVTLRNKTHGIKTKFLIISGRMKSPPLIGKPSLMKLGMLQIVEDGSLCRKNELRNKAVKSRTDSIEGLLTHKRSQDRPSN